MRADIQDSLDCGDVLKDVGWTGLDDLISKSKSEIMVAHRRCEVLENDTTAGEPAFGTGRMTEMDVSEFAWSRPECRIS
jgi:hypothetical protein